MRVFEVTGGTVVPGSVVQEPSTDATTATTATTVTLGLSTRLPSRAELRYPEATFDRAVCPSDPNVLSRTAVVAAMPTSKEACKRGVWRRFVNAEGSAFPNQGRCVSFVVARRK